MKPTTMLGIALLGLAVALVGLNAFMPAWPGLEGASSEVSTSVTHTTSPRSLVLNAPSPSPSSALIAPIVRAEPRREAVPAQPRHARRIRKIAKSGKPAHRAAGKGKSQPKPPIAVIFIRPTSSPVPVVVLPPRPVAIAPRPRHRMYAIPVKPRFAPEPVIDTASDAATTLARSRKNAEVDAMRRTAIGLARAASPGTSISSAEIQPIRGGLYRAVLVERTAHGTVVESMHLKPAKTGGVYVTSRHQVSNTPTDPFIGDPSAISH